MKDEARALQGQRAYWDENLDTKNLSHDSGALQPDLEEEIGFLTSPEYVYARDRLGDPAGRWIVDIGCGMGVNALALARAGAHVIAFDLSPQRLHALMRWARAEGLHDRISPVVGQIEAAPFADHTLDGAFTKSVLIHTRIEAAGREIARILRPTGCGVFIEPSRFNPFVWLYRLLFAPKIWRRIAFYFDDARWRRFRQAFGSFERHPFFFLGFAAFYWQFARRDLQRFRRALKWWGRIDHLLFRLCPPLRALRWMDVVVVKACLNERESDGTSTHRDS